MPQGDVFMPELVKAYVKQTNKFGAAIVKGVASPE